MLWTGGVSSGCGETRGARRDVLRPRSTEMWRSREAMPGRAARLLSGLVGFTRPDSAERRWRRCLEAGAALEWTVAYSRAWCYSGRGMGVPEAHRRCTAGEIRGRWDEARTAVPG
ncbi:hypothetical protein NDU88_002066 [Pleurodeles waltl]|uniref:Uncharacterized protein n=1 Tax=Pleurodeles waltl TaxID=8319 RepID=A0AAV7T0W7_PLEWA|nr:hypothetical protein NDU88_002066 [Pleurodeles waltl]